MSFDDIWNATEPPRKPKRQRPNSLVRWVAGFWYVPLAMIGVKLKP